MVSPVDMSADELSLLPPRDGEASYLDDLLAQARLTVLQQARAVPQCERRAAVRGAAAREAAATEEDFGFHTGLVW